MSECRRLSLVLVSTTEPAREYVLCRYCSSFFYDDEIESAACSYHRSLPVNIGSTGPRGDHADLWTFPCCATTVKAQVVEGRDRTTEQTPGCITGRHVREVGWRLFISYARRDEPIAHAMESELRRRGHQPWRDRSDIVPATEWIAAIDDAIDRADHFVVLLTPSAAASTQVLRELDLALDTGKHVVPILLEDCVLPDRVRELNCLDWRSKTERFGFYIMSDGFKALREAVVFGAPDGYWAKLERREQSDGRLKVRLPQQTTRQTILVKAGQEVLGTIHSPTRWDWSVGHLVSVDGIVYAVTDVIAWTPSTVELAVRRATIGIE